MGWYFWQNMTKFGPYDDQETAKNEEAFCQEVEMKMTGRINISSYSEVFEQPGSLDSNQNLIGG